MVVGGASCDFGGVHTKNPGEEGEWELADD